MKHTILKRVLATLMVLACVAMCFAGCDKGADDKVLVIGGSGPLTGENASYGISVQRGAQIAVDEINKAGGVNGFTLKLEMLDDEAAPDQAATNFNTLMDKGMKVSIGCVTSGAQASFADVAKDEGLLIVTPSASAEECIKHDNAFRVCFGDPDQGSYAAKFIDENKIATKVAVIYESSDNYSKGLHDAFVATAKGLSFEVVADEAFTKDTNTDFSSQISAAKEAGADMIFLPIYYGNAAKIITQAKSEGMIDDSVKFLGCDGLDGIISEMGDNKALVEGVTLITPFFADSADENIKNFVAMYNEKYSATPDQFAADAYDAIYAIKAALEKADIKDLDDAELNAKLIKAMTEIEVAGTTGKMTWDVSGAPTKGASAVVITDGKYAEFVPTVTE